MEQFLKEKSDFPLISSELPLIYNLNILENIAIIKEVHENLSTKKAEKKALEMLTILGLSHIALQRSNQCSVMEIFYTMVIRALMCSEKQVIIKISSSLLGDSKKMNTIIEKIVLLAMEKTILIVDTQENENYYKESLCTIIK